MNSTLADRLNSNAEQEADNVHVDGNTGDSSPFTASSAHVDVVNNDIQNLNLFEKRTEDENHQTNGSDSDSDDKDAEVGERAEILQKKNGETETEVTNSDSSSNLRTKSDTEIKENCDSSKDNDSDTEDTEETVLEGDNQTDSRGGNDDEFADFSEDSGSDAEYESAEEGEEIHADKENLRQLEDTLTEEEKEERRSTAKALKEEGNELFRCGSYKSAIRLYSRALRTCPLKYPRDRAIMYSNRGACKMRLEEYEDSIKDCSKALELHPHYLKALMRRAELSEKTEKLEEALTDYQKILELDPSQHTAREACLKLPDQIKERNEKLKEEMMGKLKDLGNMVLRPFGLSTNNFQMRQDPNSGGYSVNFVQNPGQ